jgi:CheY-like chemotaxis protein
MIVDDNKEFLEELQEMLSLSGYIPFGISDSTVAFDVARKKRPDLILLDLKMSQMSGFDVAQELKQCPQTTDIPIVAISGYFPLEKQSVLLDMSNMKACLKKPFSVADIITQIEEILKDSRGNAKPEDE